MSGLSGKREVDIPKGGLGSNFRLSPSSGQNRVSMIHPALGRQRTKSTRLREPTPPADRELVTKPTVVECLFARPKINQPF
jgi:hypothetical protein